MVGNAIYPRKLYHADATALCTFPYEITHQVFKPRVLIHIAMAPSPFAKLLVVHSMIPSSATKTVAVPFFLLVRYLADHVIVLKIR